MVPRPHARVVLTPAPEPSTSTPEPFNGIWEAVLIHELSNSTGTSQGPDLAGPFDGLSPGLRHLDPIWPFRS